MPGEHEVVRTLSREDAAATLGRLADGIGAGSVRVDAEQGSVVVDVPEEVDLEVEVEVDDETELEVELGMGDAEVTTEESGASATSERGEEAAGSEGQVAEDRGETAGSEGQVADDGEATESAASVADADQTSDPVVGPAGGRGDGATFELFRDAADEWRWRLVHRNGNVIADSGEGYARKGSAKKGLASVARNAPGASVVEKSD